MASSTFLADFFLSFTALMEVITAKPEFYSRPSLAEFWLFVLAALDPVLSNSDPFQISGSVY